MAQAEANGILIEYEAFGRRADPAVVLVAGNGAQMLFWETEFCELLAGRGLFVVRFDNRDSGLSTTFDELGVPDMAEAYAAQREGRPFRPPYTLRDMSDDIAGLLDALGIGRAIVCGASMGGAVAQTFAFAHPERTLGLVSMMSSTGNPDNPQIDPQTLAIVTEEPPSSPTETGGAASATSRRPRSWFTERQTRSSPRRPASTRHAAYPARSFSSLRAWPTTCQWARGTESSTQSRA